ncbi:MAG: glycosyltransferase family 2 protein [Bacteroidota bacterium]
MKISILLPVFNTATFLPSCLDSVLAQTEENWELLAIDDFSTDESWAILKAYQERDARIRAYQNTAKGIIPALRLAYQKSKGSFITRMDSDDLMSPNKLGALKSLLLKNGTGKVATALVKYFAETGIKNGYHRYENWLNSISLTEGNFSAIYKECPIASPCWMVHRVDLERCGGFETEVYPEDYDLCFRFYAQNLQPICHAEVLHYWRDYPERTSRNDPNYADNRFLELKLHYFLRLEHDAARPLCLWGAGKKGKRIARMLQQQGIAFHWCCDTVNKIGRDIYGLILQPYQVIGRLVQPQVIIAIAAPDAQENIHLFLEQHQLASAFFFC